MVRTFSCFPYLFLLVIILFFQSFLTSTSSFPSPFPLPFSLSFPLFFSRFISLRISSLDNDRPFLNTIDENEAIEEDEKMKKTDFGGKKFDAKGKTGFHRHRRTRTLDSRYHGKLGLEGRSGGGGGEGGEGGGYNYEEDEEISGGENSEEEEEEEDDFVPYRSLSYTGGHDDSQYDVMRSPGQGDESDDVYNEREAVDRYFNAANEDDDDNENGILIGKEVGEYGEREEEEGEEDEGGEDVGGIWYDVGDVIGANSDDDFGREEKILKGAKGEKGEKGETGGKSTGREGVEVCEEMDWERRGFFDREMIDKFKRQIRDEEDGNDISYKARTSNSKKIKQIRKEENDENEENVEIDGDERETQGRAEREEEALRIKEKLVAQDLMFRTQCATKYFNRLTNIRDSLVLKQKLEYWCR